MPQATTHLVNVPITMTILIVEDHKDVAFMLKLGLEEYGYHVDVASDGIDGEVKARTGTYDLLIVDWMMPGQDGAHLIQRLRKDGNQVPILMLTARAEKKDQIEALDTGADDYLTKPFSFEVLLARLRALSRRANNAQLDLAAQMHLAIGPLCIDQRQRTVTIDDTTLDLRTKEYQLLVLLAENPNQVLTRTVIVERIWGNMFVTDDVLNTTISSLRRKLSEATESTDHPAMSIETLRSVGYRLKVAPDAADRTARPLSPTPFPPSFAVDQPS